MRKKTEAEASELLLRACCTLRASEQIMVAAKREAGEAERVMAVSQYHKEKRRWQFASDAYLAIVRPP